MENTPLKFRQPVFINGKFNRWHYWGFISDKDEFAGITAPFHIARKSQQFIGRLDDNNKEIYLGDIVRIGGREMIHEEWDIGYVVSKHLGHLAVRRDDFKGSDVGISFRDFDKIKVIGNTTENPELLRSD